jgi:hypothetical protein
MAAIRRPSDQTHDTYETIYADGQSFSTAPDGDLQALVPGERRSIEPIRRSFDAISAWINSVTDAATGAIELSVAHGHSLPSTAIGTGATQAAAGNHTHDYSDTYAVHPVHYESLPTSTTSMSVDTWYYIGVATITDVAVGDVLDFTAAARIAATGAWTNPALFVSTSAASFTNPNTADIVRGFQTDYGNAVSMKWESTNAGTLYVKFCVRPSGYGGTKQLALNDGDHLKYTYANGVHWKVG